MERVQNLIQEEIGKLLKITRKGKHPNPKSAKAGRLNTKSSKPSRPNTKSAK